jgi:hypothetical protein
VQPATSKNNEGGSVSTQEVDVGYVGNVGNDSTPQKAPAASTFPEDLDNEVTHYS